jgi:hypothetical protein
MGIPTGIYLDGTRSGIKLNAALGCCAQGCNVFGVSDLQPNSIFSPFNTGALL